MTSSLDMSLDDIIRNKRRTEGHVRDSRREPRVSGSGPDRRAPARGPIRTNPYPVRPQMQVPAARQGELVQSGGSDMEGKLHISNLDSGVSNEDIKVIFSEVGDLKRYSINYNENGISKGTAEVVFFRQADAMAAIKRYNNVELDGKSIIIELVGANVVVPPPKTSTPRKPNMASKRDQQKVGGRAYVRGCGGGGNGPNAAGRGVARGRGGGGQTGKKLSAEDLDAELDKYHLEATRIK